jgi:hypothetical protein
MTRAQIIEMQRRVGTTPDGFWGPKSIAACQKHLRAMMPSPNRWPNTNQSALSDFYGVAGDTSRHTRIDVGGLGVRFNGQAVASITCHQRVADSLLAIIRELATTDDGRAALSQYAGVYNNRPMRGGTLPSLHARAAAIDLMPGGNGLHTAWPTRAAMPLSVMEVFSRHGWLSAGAFWGRDAMHFQATR